MYPCDADIAESNYFPGSRAALIGWLSATDNWLYTPDWVALFCQIRRLCRNGIFNITFEYSIAPGAAVAASSGKMAIISPSAATGVVGTPTIDTADYNPGDATVTSAEGVTLTADQKAALKTLTVDFSNVTFAEPGIYRYLITETSADQQGITYDTQINNANDAVSKQRTLDVYVTHSDAVGATEATEWSYGGNTYASLAEAEAARTAANDPTGEISNNATAGEAGLF